MNFNVSGGMATRLWGFNLNPASVDSSSSWSNWWINWQARWDVWTRPCLEDVLRVGGNCVRLIGDVYAVLHGDITLSQYLAYWDMVGNWCLANGVYLSPSLFSYNIPTNVFGVYTFGTDITTPGTICYVAGQLALHLANATYNTQVVAIDICNEGVTAGPSGGSTAMTTTQAGHLYDYIKAAGSWPVSPAIPLYVSDPDTPFAGGSSWSLATNYATLNTNGKLDVFGFHCYWQPASATVLRSIRSANPSKGIIFDEFGIQTASGAALATTASARQSQIQQTVQTIQDQVSSAYYIQGGLYWVSRSGSWFRPVPDAVGEYGMFARDGSEYAYRDGFLLTTMTGASVSGNNGASTDLLLPFIQQRNPSPMATATKFHCPFSTAIASGTDLNSLNPGSLTGGVGSGFNVIGGPGHWRVDSQGYAFCTDASKVVPQVGGSDLTSVGLGSGCTITFLFNQFGLAANDLIGGMIWGDPDVSHCYQLILFCNIAGTAPNNDDAYTAIITRLSPGNDNLAVVPSISLIHAHIYKLRLSAFVVPGAINPFVALYMTDTTAGTSETLLAYAFDTATTQPGPNFSHSGRVGMVMVSANRTTSNGLGMGVSDFAVTVPATPAAPTSYARRNGLVLQATYPSQVGNFAQFNWYRDGDCIKSTTGSLLYLMDVDPASPHSYTVSVSDTSGLESDQSSALVLALPPVNVQAMLTLP